MSKRDWQADVWKRIERETCGDLVAFADGELEPHRAEAFRVHLRTCEACRVDLVDTVQLKAHLELLGPIPPPPRRRGLSLGRCG